MKARGGDPLLEAGRGARHPGSWLLVLLLLPVGLGAAALQQPASPGEKLYRDHCAVCHGDDGRADTPAGKMTATPDMTVTPWKHGTSQSEVEKITREGAGKMPGYEKRLKPAEIVQVAEYTRQLCGVDKPAGDSRDEAR